LDEISSYLFRRIPSNAYLVILLWANLPQLKRDDTFYPMNSLSEAQLESFSLRFRNRDVEHEFGLQEIPMAKAALQTALVVSFVSSVLFFGLDYLALGRFELLNFLLRVPCFFASNAIVALLLLLKVPKTRHHLNLLTTAFGLSAQAIQFAISLSFPELGEYYLLVLILLTSLPLITLDGVDFAYAAPMMVLIVVAFLVKVFAIDNMDLYTKFLQAFVIFSFSGILLSAGYLLEQAQRKKWWVIQGLTSQREALIAKNKELEQFAYIASHDLQEPLRSITSFTHLLDEEYREQIGKDGGQYLNFLLEASERMRRLIKGLLDYSRLGRDAAQTRVDVNALMREILADLGVAIKECNAEIKFTQLPTLNAFELELRQLLQNLISNALKFRKPGTPPVITVSAQQMGSTWEFAIKDNGIGIAKEHQEKIFMIFQRLHNRSQYEGTGIGLANCVKIAAMHNGKIWVESEKGQGSTFKFTIPIS
jgi:signal transduction histidine kinase